MLTCSACADGGGATAPFERREYVRLETIVDRHDEPQHDEGTITDSLGAERTYRCLSCGGHDVDWITTTQSAATTAQASHASRQPRREHPHGR